MTVRGMQGREKDKMEGDRQYRSSVLIVKGMISGDEGDKLIQPA